MVGAQQCKEKRQEGKNDEKTDRARGRNHPPTSQTNDARMWEEDKNIKQKEEQKKETGSEPQPRIQKN